MLDKDEGYVVLYTSCRREGGAAQAVAWKKAD